MVAFVPGLVGGSLIGGGSAAGGSALAAGGIGSLLGGGFAGLFGGGGGKKAAQIQADAFLKGIAELRRQFDLTQENVSPFLQAGQEALPGVVQGSTIGGFGQRLNEIFNSGALQPLIDERMRAAQGQLAAGGLTRSGTALREIANIPTSLGLDIENLLNSRQTNLAGSGQNAAIGLGALGQQNAQSIANLQGQIGQGFASGFLADQQAQQQSIGNLIGGATAAAFLFSDRRLKKNIKKIGEAKGMNLYKWDWIDQAKGTLIEACENYGFMADEVRERFPKYVFEFCGWELINYPALLNELEAA